MKKKVYAVLIVVTLFLNILVHKLDDYFFDDQVILPKNEPEIILPHESVVPTGFVQAGELISESEWGKIDVTEIQGIAQSETHWYITNQWEIFKIPKDSLNVIKARVHLVSLQKELRKGWYRHFGGIVYHNGFIYIATTGRVHALTTEKATPIIIVLNANLEFVKYGFLPSDAQKNAAWVGFNPVTQNIYSSNGARELLEYNPTFENGETIQLIQQHKLHYANVNLPENEWKKMASQGGTFDSSGTFYYVLDKKDANNENYTGIHGFVQKQDGYHEIILTGVNNKGEDTDFINIKYIGSQKNDRLWELEDITITKEGDHQFLYSLQLHNGKMDHARIVRYRLNYN